MPHVPRLVATVDVSGVDALLHVIQFFRAPVGDDHVATLLELVEVAYDQMEGQRLRHAARFLRWRPDRDPKSCTYDQLEVPVDYDVADVLAGGPDSPAGES